MRRLYVVVIKDFPVSLKITLIKMDHKNNRFIKIKKGIGKSFLRKPQYIKYRIDFSNEKLFVTQMSQLFEKTSNSQLENSIFCFFTSGIVFNDFRLRFFLQHISPTLAI